MNCIQHVENATFERSLLHAGLQVFKVVLLKGNIISYANYVGTMLFSIYHDHSAVKLQEATTNDSHTFSSASCFQYS